MRFLKLLSVLLSTAALMITLPVHGQNWKAASTKVVITPGQSMWMAGYASRDKPSEGTLHDLWAKVLVLEDSRGNRSVLVTADIIGFPKETTDRIRTALNNKHRLTAAQIILNSSHTHTGPVLKDALHDYYGVPLSQEQLGLIERYTVELENKIVNAVDEAIKKLEPARLSASNGVARFQVNRRNNAEGSMTPEMTLRGPNDYAVPVLKVEKADGAPVALVFGYACHTTVLGTYKWSGDYAGFAQIELEKRYPGFNAMFFQGAGGDQNPIPRRSEALAEQYGISLAAAVSAAIGQEMKELPAQLKTGYREIDLLLSPVPTRESLVQTEREASGYVKKWAQRLIAQIDRGEKLMQSYPYYPVQIWNLGGLNWVTLGGETVVEYSLLIKKIFGNETFVMGYSNDMMAYIPSLTVLQEGGYEGATSQVYFKGMSTTWDASIETRILNGVIGLAEEMQLPKQYNKLHVK